MTAEPRTALSFDRPFPGLRPYAFEDSPFYFGREDQIYSLYRLLDRSHFIAVVGSSGSGKSSLVRAGLLPLLDAETKNAGGRSWRWVEMRPGGAPLKRLGDALASPMPEAEDDVDRAINAARRERIGFALRQSSFGLAEALDKIEGLGDSSFVLVVDQFEELFRYAASTTAGQLTDVGLQLVGSVRKDGHEIDGECVAGVGPGRRPTGKRLRRLRGAELAGLGGRQEMQQVVAP